MFEIIIKEKAKIEKLDSNDFDITEAIYSIYKNGKFMIFINWNGFYIPMNGSTLSQIFDDIIEMLEALLDIESNNFSVNFLDSCFTAVWEFSKENENIKIKSEWIEIAPYNLKNITIEELNKVSNIVKINKVDFIRKWDFLIKIIKDDLIISGYDIDLEGLEYLRNLK
ncbi:hypothetical protein [Chryseobacterium hagamense]|uniref:Uncharacterized protein n=1 Tax=Chryseobacterium hagamense TaxID=395935 RepID=A0A511YNX4_9FLAO|nr:hypothetical protein [Chryseobacterium hagamense]GEN76890.1 hypothetical protein CHA01nite_26300 [Chryseobacterium hagamense]